MIMWY